MAYYAIHGRDTANFSTPVAHRVLTVSAADADATLLSQSSASSTASGPAAPSHFVPTGIESLDGILAGGEAVLPDDDGPIGELADDSEDDAADAVSTVAAADKRTQTADGSATTKAAADRTARPTGGIRRGQLTEIWGPPGVGKTAFGIQVVANTLRHGNSAVWIDCFQAVSHERLASVVDKQVSDVDSAKSLQDDFVHFVCPSLPHFLALLCPPPPAQPPPECIPADASVLVIDSLSALVNYALPRTAQGKGAPLMANGKRGPAPHEKRTQVLQYITAALERLAETRNLAIVVLTQCATRVQAERGAALAPALNAFVWDRGISTRLALFRDWAWKDSQPISGRFVGVQKVNGCGSGVCLDSIVAFDITETGLVEDYCTAIPPRWSVSTYKRKLGDTELGRRGDADDEDYGWDNEDDDNLPSMPPQWQGSEDLLLGHRYEEEGEDDAEDPRGDEDGDGGDGDSEGVTSALDVALGEGGQSAGPNLRSDAWRPGGQGPGAKRSPRSVADSEEDSDI